MANIRMNPNSFGNYSFQRSKVPTMVSPRGLNGTNKELSPGQTKVKYWRNSSNNLKHCESEQSNKCKLPFSEKLKHLLENGGSVEHFDQEDPYAFQDVELTSFSNSVNGFNDSMGNYRVSPVTVKGVNFGTPTVRVRPSIEPTNIKKVQSSVTSYPISKPSCKLSVLTHSSFRQSDILPRHPSEAAKVKSPLLKPTSHGQSSGNARFYQSHIEKLGKNVKGVVAPHNGRSVGCGKPMNFGKSQMSKLAIAKIEKSMESKNKNCSKGKPLQSIQKTASISRLLNKTKRPVPTRSASLDSDAPATKNRVGARKSLLEESLLGMKSGDWTANRVGRTTVTSSPAMVQTATTTVKVPPKPRPRFNNQGALQHVWDLRNKIKLLKRNYQSFGLLLDDPPEQEIDSSESHTFQNYWFSLCNDYNSFSGHNRNAKLAQLKTELRHKLLQQQWTYRDEYQEQMAKIIIKAARHQPNLTAFLIRLENSHRSKNKLERWRGQAEERSECGYLIEGRSPCSRVALPSVGFCEAHLIHNQNQLLFTSCSAEIPPDNRPCSSPALGKLNEQVFCTSHQRLQLNLQKPKKPAAEKPEIKTGTQGRRSRSSLCSSRTGRSRKRKRQSMKEKKEYTDIISVAKDPDPFSLHVEANACVLAADTMVVSKSDIDESQDVEVGEDLPLDSAELASLATQATRLLEEHDLTNVLNHIPADAFNDLFTGDKEEYEPTLQETEELERALEAVDKDVKSLEKQTQGIFDLLDEQTILAALPEVVPVLYQNGFGGLGPLEQTLCGLHPDTINSLPIPPQADVLQS